MLQLFDFPRVEIFRSFGLLTSVQNVMITQVTVDEGKTTKLVLTSKEYVKQTSTREIAEEKIFLYSCNDRVAFNN